tara:strand:- start:6252 stop:6602 length:351 start_codon:yes stop_codon:yes gene_type:complete
MNKLILSNNELNPVKLRFFLKNLKIPKKKSWEIEQEKSSLAEPEELKTDLSKLSKAEARKLYKRILSLKRTVKRVKAGGSIKVDKPVSVKKTNLKRKTAVKRKVTKGKRRSGRVNK